MQINNFRNIIYFIFIIAIIHSCSSHSSYTGLLSCEQEFPGLFSAVHTGKGLSITGKARLELNQYRVRGICRIHYLPPDNLRIDFRHSSLFGAYKEDASIFIRAAHMAIFDRERGTFFDRDSSLAIIDRHIGFRLYPDDLICALTLTSPDCSTIGSLEMRSSEDEWQLVCEWRGRHIEIRGKEGMGPETFRQCQNDESSCYIISYSSYGEWNDIRFPKRIVLVEENGSQKIALNITDVREEIVSRETFEVSNRWMR